MVFVLRFHPDLGRSTARAKSIEGYYLFDYNTSEALHLSELERQLVLDCFSKIELELSQSVDKHSKKLIASNIELFLNYCERFYDRQFITRENVNKGILERFEELLNSYFASEKPYSIGLPSRSEEHTSEIQSLMRISYAVFCLKQKKNNYTQYI